MEEYYYDRTRNFKDIDYVDLTGFCPSYGLQASFSTKNENLKFSDNYFTLIPASVNSLVVDFSVSYDVNQEGAQKIANDLEALSGQNSFVFKTDNLIYKDLSGYCDGYSINHLSENSYRVNTTVSVDEAPNLLNWKNTNFTEYEFKEWSEDLDYELDDIVYFDNSEEKWNNFYYCTGEHSSASENSPTGINTAWSQSFYWQPDVGTTNQVQFSVSRFDGTYGQRIKDSKNISLVPISYNFTSISKKQLKTMLHFLELKGGYRRFRHHIPTVYNRPKVYICQSWDHVWKSPESHDLQVVFKEDPLGVIPREVPVGGEIPTTIQNVALEFFGGYDNGGFEEDTNPW